MEISPLSEPLKVFLLDLLEHDPEIQAAIRGILTPQEIEAAGLLAQFRRTMVSTTTSGDPSPPMKRGPAWLHDRPQHPDNKKGERA